MKYEKKENKELDDFDRLEIFKEVEDQIQAAERAKEDAIKNDGFQKEDSRLYLDENGWIYPEFKLTITTDKKLNCTTCQKWQVVTCYISARMDYLSALTLINVPTIHKIAQTITVFFL